MSWKLFILLVLVGTALNFVSNFKYLCNIIRNNLRDDDDDDTEREIKCMFVICNTLISRFKLCRSQVKVKLIQSYCLCLYNSALWLSHKVTTLRKFIACYNRPKCAKRFFGYAKFDSLTPALLQTGLPSANTVLYNYKYRFYNMVSVSIVTV